MLVIRSHPYIPNQVVEMECPNVTPEQIGRWQAGGVLIQEAMPTATPDEREFIKTGLTPELWDEMFADADERSETDGM